MRISKIQRQTNETDIQLKINLDGSGVASIDTGIGFYDHMLNHVALHGLFDLNIRCKGDLEVDPHHTVEDCALVLGQGIDKALSDRKGINRMGSMYVPMDEALGFVAVDLSGRPYTVFHGEWHSPYVGGISTSLVPHFFESLAVTARCNLHVRMLYGQDDHHQAEALFKALGRALNIATRFDSKRGDRIPSTKGNLT